VDDVIPARNLVLDRPLGRDPRARVGIGEAIACYEPSNLLLRIAGADDHFVEVVFVTSFEEKRDIRNREARVGREIDSPFPYPAVHVGVDDCFEVGTRETIGEDDARERGAIERAVIAENRRAKPRDDGREASRTRRDGIARQAIRIDNRDARRGKLRRAVGLSCRYPAGQCGEHHDQPLPSRAVAAETVFLSSMAIVSGPTPPGTGVSAPATSATPG